MCYETSAHVKLVYSANQSCLPWVRWKDPRVLSEDSIQHVRAHRSLVTALAPFVVVTVSVCMLHWQIVRF